MKTEKNYYNDTNTSRLAVLEQIAKETNETLKRLENKIENSFSELKFEIKELESESWSRFRWLLGIMLTLFLANTSAILTVITKVWH